MSLSLESSIRTCKVSTGWANRLQTDRIQNPDLMMCPVWNGYDNTGRKVCANSFYTMNAGCNSPLERINVENQQRPQYFEYITLDAAGLSGGGLTNMNTADSALRSKDVDQMSARNPSFGNQFGSTNATRCENYSYKQAMAQESQARRMQQGLNVGFKSNAMKKMSGF